jgi:predicted cupin superfamily sugar epimerase
VTRAAELTTLLGLRPHPEGGRYAEIFRSSLSVQPADERPARAALTSIYFLLRAGEQSRWHRVQSDEAWHWIEGDPLQLWIWAPGASAATRLEVGPPTADGRRPVAVVPAGAWQAAVPAGSYTLVACDVGPGFDFADFTLAESAEDRAVLAALGAESAALL